MKSIKRYVTNLVKFFAVLIILLFGNETKQKQKSIDLMILFLNTTTIDTAANI